MDTFYCGVMNKMSASKPHMRIRLNKTTHSVRASQAILQYGVGAMVDFPNQTLMTAAPELWQNRIERIRDERLEKALQVDYFGLPLGSDSTANDDGLAYVRFPEWYFCPSCRLFQPLSKWISDYRKRASDKQLENDYHMVKNVRCPTCKAELVVARIITVCECGHIDDFPWVKWVHCENIKGGPKRICQNPKLTFKTSATSAEGLEGITIECETCNARATLRGAFSKGKLEQLDRDTDGYYNFKCTGRHPWKNAIQDCSEYPKVLQRGSSSVYFPIVASSLVIPPYSSKMTNEINNSASYEDCRKSVIIVKNSPHIRDEDKPNAIETEIINAAETISFETGYSKQAVEKVLKRQWLESSQDSGYASTSVKYRAEEFEALSGEVEASNDGDFIREEIPIEKYNLPGIKGLALVHSIREVRALLGFSRIEPATEMNIIDSSNIAVPIKLPSTKWYPAYQVRGEGIFLEFDNDAIKKWETQFPQVLERAQWVNHNYKESFVGANRPRNITPKFLLIHTLAHLLIKQLSFECGYSIASLRERIYCGEVAEGKEMAGVLIYTASGDSEGTMGGLVRQGRPDVFSGIFKKALEMAVACSNDPVCSLSKGQGRESLNLSACYSCTLIPETSCEEFNVFLDRGVVVGTCEDEQMGFYSDFLFGKDSHRFDAPPKKQKRVRAVKTTSEEPYYVIDKGVDLKDTSYNDIWDSLERWSDNTWEKELLEALKDNVTLFADLEKPYKDCVFKVGTSSDVFECDLYWPNLSVALFTEDNKDGYDNLRRTSLRCVLLSDNSNTVESINSLLSEDLQNGNNDS